MFVNARVVLPPVADVVSVPETAVDRTLYGDLVFIVAENGKDAEGKPAHKAVQTFVETGPAFEGRISITRGVSAGDVVVSSGPAQAAERRAGGRGRGRAAAADADPGGVAAMRFTDVFVRRPVLAAVVSLLILLIGLRAAFELPVRQYPELKNTVITVTTSYPGAPAELMQGFITTPISQAVATAEGIDYMTASSAQGQSTVKAYRPAELRPQRRHDRRHGEGAAGQVPDPAGGQRSDHPQVDRRHHGRHVHGLLEPGADRPRDHRLSDPCRPAPAGHRARRGAGRDPGRSALRDADLARPGPAGRARPVGGRGARRRSAPTTSSRHPARPRATSPWSTSSPTPA